MSLRMRAGVVATACLLSLAPGLVGASTSPKTTKLSVRTSGAQVTGTSYVYGRAVSKTGRFVVFESGAELVPSDANSTFDIYLRDRRAKKTVLISVDSDETQPPTGASFAPEVSADGRFVLFESGAQLSDLDTNSHFDIYLRDRDTGKTKLVALDSAGVYDPDADNFDGAISPNGRYLAFVSESDNLVADDSNSQRDVFVRDRATGITTRASISSAGVEADGVSSNPCVADNGRAAFTSSATNLVASDGNGVPDVFIHYPTSGKTRRVSIRSNGSEGAYESMDCSISRTGTVISFESLSSLSAVDGNNLRDIYVRVPSTGKTSLVSVRSDGSHPTQEADANSGALSYGGRYLTFSSDKHLVALDKNDFDDMYRHDRKTGKTILISKGAGGEVPDSYTGEGAISGNGLWVAFDTDATNMISQDTNPDYDVFIRGPLP